MNADRDGQAPAERYALARHGMPLPRGPASVPRARWLPASLRGRALPERMREAPQAPFVDAEAGEEDGFETGIGGILSPLPRESTGSASAPAAAADAPKPHAEAAGPSPAVQGRRGESWKEASTPDAGPAVHPDAAPGSPVRVATVPAEPAASPATIQPPAGRAMADRIPGPPRAPSAPEPERARAPAAGAQVAPPAAPHAHPAGSRHTAMQAPALGPGDARHSGAEPVASRLPPGRPPTVEATVAAMPVVEQRSPEGPPFPVAIECVARVQAMGTLASSPVPAPAHAASGTGERPPPVRPVDATVLAALQRPMPPPSRTVRLDRVQVAVQAPASPIPRAAGAPAPPSAAPARPPARAASRNPWSGYFARRD
ncbi:hypothetical protein [Pseudoxanthomonas suwonensis]|uniref:Uncharacterized protein n=1 Tax=Pseudoxanthomonas suwonensis TaxID=314722 RepID=A0A0E3UN08_9GAMM|nr:hypothetical protein [Pseudoxanthomonas suwonensis]AKC86781.1 hypothetical protein WQ53_08435 [Pseudoxanthomonas suwonensis]